MVAGREAGRQGPRLRRRQQVGQQRPISYRSGAGNTNHVAGSPCNSGGRRPTAAGNADCVIKVACLWTVHQCAMCAAMHVPPTYVRRGAGGPTRLTPVMPCAPPPGRLAVPGPTCSAISLSAGPGRQGGAGQDLLLGYCSSQLVATGTQTQWSRATGCCSGTAAHLR